MKKSVKFSKRKSAYLVSVVLLAVIVISVIVIRSRQHQVAVINSTEIPSTGQSTNNGKDSTADQNTSKASNDKDSSGSTTTPPTTTSSATLTSAPSGSFVSNHLPSLSGSPRPKEEESTCTTIPGASCSIQFTKTDGATKELKSQVAGDNGTVIWNWDVASAGFTPGEWTITATATLNGVSKSTTDSIKMVVSQ